MRHSRWMLRGGAAAVAGLTIASALPTGEALAKTAPAGPTIKLIAAQNKISVSLLDLGSEQQGCLPRPWRVRGRSRVAAAL